MRLGRREPRSNATLTSGGRSDSDANELTVAPAGPASSAVVTTVTGAHTPAIRERNSLSVTTECSPARNNHDEYDAVLRSLYSSLLDLIESHTLSVLPVSE